MMVWQVGSVDSLNRAKAWLQKEKEENLAEGRLLCYGLDTEFAAFAGKSFIVKSR